jgi:AcrR family transcriptional regulator
VRATTDRSAGATTRAQASQQAARASQQDAPLSRKEATQARILDAAIALFAERGYDGASITVIAARAGVSRATVFWHFSDKASLFQEACRRMLVPFVEEFRKSLEDVDPRKRVFELFNVYELFVSRYLETIEHFVRWALESPTLRTALHKPLFALHDQFTQDIRRAFLELWGDPTEAAELSSAFIALLDGNLLLDLMESSPEKRDLRRAGLRRLAELATAAKPLP